MTGMQSFQNSRILNHENSLWIQKLMGNKSKEITNYSSKNFSNISFLIIRNWPTAIHIHEYVSC